MNNDLSWKPTAAKFQNALPQPKNARGELFYNTSPFITKGWRLNEDDETQWPSAHEHSLTQRAGSYCKLNSHLVGRSSFRLPRFLRGRFGSVSPLSFSESRLSWATTNPFSRKGLMLQAAWRGRPFSRAFCSCVGRELSEDLLPCLSPTSPLWTWSCEHDWIPDPLWFLDTPTSSVSDPQLSTWTRKWQY